MNPNISAKVVRAYAKSRRAHRTIERISQSSPLRSTDRAIAAAKNSNASLAADALADLESAAAELREFLLTPQT